MLHFYFDGETTPRFNANTADLLNGRFSPFGFPFSYPVATAANGANLYFPFPYAKSLKITVDSSGDDGAKSMYYQVGYRTYDAGTTVDTFDPAKLPALQGDMDTVRKALTGTPDTSGTQTATVTSGRQVGRAGSSCRRPRTAASSARWQSRFRSPSSRPSARWTGTTPINRTTSSATR